MFQRNLTKAFELLTNLPENFFSEGRKDTHPQERDFDVSPGIDKNPIDLSFKVE